MPVQQCVDARGRDESKRKWRQKYCKFRHRRSVMPYTPRNYNPKPALGTSMHCSFGALSLTSRHVVSVLLPASCRCRGTCCPHLNTRQGPWLLHPCHPCRPCQSATKMQQSECRLRVKLVTCLSIECQCNVVLQIRRSNALLATPVLSTVEGSSCCIMEA